MTPKPRYRLVRARKRRICEGCRTWIEPGDPYLRWVTFPSDGIWDSIGTLPECRTCATRCGREQAFAEA